MGDQSAIFFEVINVTSTIFSLCHLINIFIKIFWNFHDKQHLREISLATVIWVEISLIKVFLVKFPWQTSFQWNFLQLKRDNLNNNFLDKSHLRFEGNFLDYVTLDKIPWEKFLEWNCLDKSTFKEISSKTLWSIN